MRWLTSCARRASPPLREGMPHRFPFRLVDRSAGTRVGGQAIVVLSAGGFYSRGPISSVALVAETMAQAIAQVHSCTDAQRMRLVALNQVRLLQEVAPGDRLLVDLREEARLGQLRRFRCRALRAGAPVAEATITVGC